MTELTAQRVTVAISPDLLDKLLVNLHPIPFDETSTLFHMGWRACQEEFKMLLTHHLNAGPLP